MSKWKKLSYERKRKLHHSVMMLVAKEGKERGLLNFDGEQPLCPQDASFTFDIGAGLTGTVSIKNHGGDNWAYAKINLKTVFVEGHLKLVDGFPKFDWMCQAYSEGGIPEEIVDMALKPIAMDEVLG